MDAKALNTHDLLDVQRLINMVVRYVLSGGVFVLAFGFLEGWRLQFLRFGGQQADVSLYFTTLFIAVTGGVAYLLHRSLLYRPILWCLERLLIRNAGLKNTNPGKLEREFSKRRNEARTASDPLQQQFDQWAAEVHFLYTAAWCVSAAVFSFAALRGASLSDWKPRMVVVASAVLFVAALRHDYRLMHEEADRITPTGA